MYMLAFSARCLYNGTIKEKLDALAPEGGPMKSGDRYTTRELCLLAREMERLFEVVRLLDPAAEERLTPISEDRLERGPWDELYVLLDTPGGVAGESPDHRRPVHALSRPLFLTENGREVPLVLELAGWAPSHLVERRRGHFSLEKASAAREELYRDELTQVFNRRYLNDFVFLRRQMDRLTRVGVIMMDLRRFKEVNDTFGHLAGDRTLEQVARVLGEHVRGHDSVIRLGGDEFVVILLDCGEDIVCRKIEELRAALVPVAEADFGYAYTDQFSPSVEMLRELLDQADRRMYQEKRRAP